MRSKRGFTMIELLIVVTIVGILTLSAIPVAADNARKARRAEGISMMGMFRTQARAVYAETGKPPHSLTGEIGKGGAGVPAGHLTGQFYIIEGTIGTGDGIDVTSTAAILPSGDLGDLFAFEAEGGVTKSNPEVGQMRFAWQSGRTKVGWGVYEPMSKK